MSVCITTIATEGSDQLNEFFNTGWLAKKTSVEFNNGKNHLVRFKVVAILNI